MKPCKCNRCSHEVIAPGWEDYLAAIQRAQQVGLQGMVIMSGGGSGGGGAGGGGGAVQINYLNPPMGNPISDLFRRW